MAGTPRAPTEFSVGRLDIVVSRDQIAPSVPGQPAQGAVTQDSITISWSASTDTGGSGLKGYDVERNGSVIATEVPTTSYVDTGLSSGATYTYRVRARDNAENVSAFSTARSATTADTTAPTVPVISAAALSSSELQVSLVTPSTDTGSGLRDYTLQVSSTGTSGWSDLATGLQAGSFPYTHGGLTASTQRYYRLRAFDIATNFSTSSVVNATTLATGLNWIGGNDTTTDVNATVGTPVDFDVAAQVVGEQSIALVSGSVPGLTYNPSTMRITGTPTTANEPTGVDLVFDADDGQGGGGGAAADWQSRISGPGVVWYHNFDADAEVNQFRWTNGYSGGDDPNGVGAGGQYVTHQASGGVDGGGFMRLTYPLGSASGRGGSYWQRPFNALTGAGNGRGQNDPGANGTITPVAFPVSNGSSVGYNWGNQSNPGWYMHPTHQASYPGKFQGHDFWLQVRVRRAQRPGPPPNSGSYSNITGKNVWLTTMISSYTAQEIVTYGQSAGEDVVNQYGRHRIYGGYNYQPFGGSQDNESVTISNLNVGWRYSGGWDTLLYHITPGPNNGTGANRTRIEIWAAHQGETSYTKIWDTLYTGHYDGGSNSVGAPGLPGWNALILAIYHNESAFNTTAFNFDYDQVIFSKETIACPQV